MANTSEPQILAPTLELKSVAPTFGTDLGAQICGSDLRAMDPGAELGFKFTNKFYCVNLLSFVLLPSHILALYRINYVISKSLDI